MNRKIRSRIAILMVLVSILAVLVSLPEKTEAMSEFVMGMMFIGSPFGMYCECPISYIANCACRYSGGGITW